MKKTVILSVVILVLGGVIGGYFVGMWKDRAREKAVAAAIDAERSDRAAVEAELASTKLAAQMSAYHLRLGKIAIDAGRLNYGTAKDEAVQYFTDLSTFAETVQGTEYEAKVRSILDHRDQIVSDLSVGSPTAAESLELMYLELAK
jgi:hypothetical protein